MGSHMGGQPVMPIYSPLSSLTNLIRRGTPPGAAFVYANMRPVNTQGLITVA
jgi:hypothetical protein